MSGFALENHIKASDAQTSGIQTGAPRSVYHHRRIHTVKGAGIVVDEENSNVGLVPNQPAMVSDVATAKAVQKFVDMLEDLEDVQDVYNNMETTDEVDAALAAEG